MDGIMKYSFNMVMTFCIAGLVVLGSVALNQDGFILLRFDKGEMVIDGRE